MVADPLCAPCEHCGISDSMNPHAERHKCAGAAPAPSSSGDKHDDGKPPMSLIPREALELEAEVFGYGEEKYGAWNWTKGLSYSRLLSAAMRHLTAFADGEDNDLESGLSHLGHLRCCTAMLIGMTKLRPELDDRRKNG